MKFDTKTHLFFAFVLLCFLIMNCEEKIAGSLNANQPPETSVFVQSADTLNFTPSVQTIFWDGSDADGFITGFFYTFAENPTENDWEWTTERSKTFPLQISGSDTIYQFQVKAVDNQNAEDPSPAVQLFPIVNSAPQIDWAVNSSIPDTTFTVASFSWTALDPDGDSTIAFFEYILDDTTGEWQQTPGDKRSITLLETDGVTEGEHAFFIRAVDIAGAKSPTIRMPENPADFWHARRPNGRYLLIDDYKVESAVSAFPDAYYQTFLDSVLGTVGENYSYWNIEEQFPSSITQFTESLKLFERIIWYTDLITPADEHFIAAQVAIPAFRQTGGKLIFAVQFNGGFGAQGNPLAFSPVDSLGQAFNVVPTNSLYYPDSGGQAQLPNITLPELTVSSFIVGLIALKPKANSIPMYRYDVANTTDDPIFIMAGQNDNTNEIDFIFSGTPLHFLRGNGNLDSLLSQILIDVFSP